MEIVVSSESPRFNGITFHMIIEKTPTFSCLKRWWNIDGDTLEFNLDYNSDLRDELILLYHLTGLGPYSLNIRHLLQETKDFISVSEFYSFVYSRPLPENVRFIRYGTCLCGVKNCDTVTSATLQPKVTSYGELFQIWGIPDYELSIRFFHQSSLSCLQLHKVETELEDCYSSCTGSELIPSNIKLEPLNTYFYYYLYLI